MLFSISAALTHLGKKYLQENPSLTEVMELKRKTEAITIRQICASNFEGQYFMYYVSDRFRLPIQFLVCIG